MTHVPSMRHDGELVARSAIQSFGKYQILERIATGGMAEIYKARLEGIGGFQRTIAIKRILPNLSQNNAYIAMLVDEAKVAGLLSHANIVQILDLGQVDGIWYIAMEYVHGRDLGRVIRRASKKGLCLPVPHAVFVAIELLKGLEYAHNRQVTRGGKAVALHIIHRDVSPPNILLSFQGEVKLTDFGIARASLKALETVSGIVKGRFDYMSPEQAAGSRALDQRSDLFSVGVVLYEMLTGTHPFRADNEIGTVERIRTGAHAPVRQRNREVPGSLAEIVARSLEVSPERRYPSATAFKEALDTFFHESGFLFTHATLANYVEGLFPEAEGRPRRADPRDFGDAPTAVEADLGDPIEHESTRALTHTSRPLHERGDPVLASATPSGRDRVIVAIDGDAPTKIRENPLLRQTEDTWDADELDGAWADEQETVIRSPLADPLPASRTKKSAALPPPGDDRSTTTQRRAQPAPSPRRPPIGWLGVVLVPLMLITGLVTGAAAVAVGGWLSGAQWSSVPPSGVRVVAPEGTSVLLNGEAVGTEFVVEHTMAHVLEVHVDGRDPWRRELELRPGERLEVVIVAPSP